MQPIFPTKSHQKALEATAEHFKKKKEVLAITLVGSVLRGHGSADADVDVDVFVKDQATIDRLSREFDKVSQSILAPLRKNKEVGRYFDIGVHMRFLNPQPKPRFWTSGPDEFEIEIAHSFVHCKLIFERNKAWTKARKRFVPYYNENLRKRRLKEVKMYCLNNIGHIEPYVKRGLYFQAYKRFYDATREFLQALFISKKKYPLDYDKWIRYELEKILKMPKLYREFVSLYELNKLESNELIKKGRRLEKLLQIYLK
ncbi:MAG: nucleotidyltransferase domain-containing protein [Candidatus Sungiibacteriota bacterium]